VQSPPGQLLQQWGFARIHFRQKNLAHYKEATPAIQPNALKLQNLSVNKKPPCGGLSLEQSKSLIQK
jgi:hypothetical protein